MSNLTDWRGTPINVGSKVVYPSRQNNRMWVTEGEVIDLANGEIAVRKIRSNESAEAHGRIDYPNIQRLTVVEE